jgi:hypothetical protein
VSEMSHFLIFFIIAAVGFGRIDPFATPPGNDRHCAEQTAGFDVHGHSSEPCPSAQSDPFAADRL